MMSNIYECPHCGQKRNSNFDVRCSYCGYQFADAVMKKEKLKKISKILNVVFLLICAPSFLLGLLFFIIGMSKTLNENKKIEGFVKTEGYFSKYDYKNCTYSDDGTQLCSGIYTYKVNEIEYQVSTFEQSNLFSEKKEIYYNPNKPEEAVILTSWNILIFAGGTFAFTSLFIFLVQFIFFRIQIKKYNKKVIQ